MAEKVNKSNTSLQCHSFINLCALYLSCHLAQRRAKTLQFMILSRNVQFILMGLEPNPIQFYQHDRCHVFSCQN